MWDEDYTDETANDNTRWFRGRVYEMRKRYEYTGELFHDTLYASDVASAPWVVAPKRRRDLESVTVELENADDTRIFQALSDRKVRKYTIRGTHINRAMGYMFGHVAKSRPEHLSIEGDFMLSLPNIEWMLAFIPDLKHLSFNKCRFISIHNEHKRTQLAKVTCLKVDLGFVVMDIKLAARGWNFYNEFFALFPHMEKLAVRDEAKYAHSMKALLHCGRLASLHTLHIILDGDVDALAINGVMDVLLWAMNVKELKIQVDTINASQLAALFDVALKMNSLQKIVLIATKVVDVCAVRYKFFPQSHSISSVHINLGDVSDISTPTCMAVMFECLAQKLDSFVWAVRASAATIYYHDSISMPLVQSITEFVYTQMSFIKFDQPNVFDLISNCHNLRKLTLCGDFSSLDKMPPITACIETLTLLPLLPETTKMFNLMAALKRPDYVRNLSLSRLLLTDEFTAPLNKQLQRLCNIEYLTLNYGGMPEGVVERMPFEFVALPRQLKNFHLETFIPFTTYVPVFNALSRLHTISRFVLAAHERREITAAEQEALVKMARSTSLTFCNLFFCTNSVRVRLNPYLFRNIRNEWKKRQPLMSRLFDDLAAFDDPTRRRISHVAAQD